MGRQIDYSGITWNPQNRTISGGFVDELIEALEYAKRVMGDDFVPPTDWGIHLHWEYQDGDIDVRIDREEGATVSRFHFSDFFIPEKADFSCGNLTDRLQWFVRKQTQEIKTDVNNQSANSECSSNGK